MARYFDLFLDCMLIHCNLSDSGQLIAKDIPCIAKKLVSLVYGCLPLLICLCEGFWIRATDTFAIWLGRTRSVFLQIIVWFLRFCLISADDVSFCD